MKKRFLKALLALVLFVALMPAARAAAEGAAEDPIYAILYDDGELVFQTSSIPEAGRTVKGNYTVSGHYLMPWHDMRFSITTVTFADIVRPSSTAYWFYNCSNLKQIRQMENLDTSSVTNMSSMFYGCSGLMSLELTPLNTSSVTDMSDMFYGCSGLTSLDLTPLNTSSVTDMNCMFYNCSGLTSLDLTSLKTSSVTDMNCMFYNCSGLTSLDLTSLNTSSVTNMMGMFCGCSGLTALDLTPLKTASVTDMGHMFYGCSGLTALDLSPLDAASVTDMSCMFYGCSGLKLLNLTPLKTSSVTDMHCMFYGCSGLTTLDLTPLKTSSVTNMDHMFSGCSGLTTLDLTPLKTASVTDMGHMFYGCSGLTALDLSPLNTASVTDMHCMFYNCSRLTSLDLTPLNTSSVTNMSWMFYGCSGLTALDLFSLDTASVTDMSNMFWKCSSLTRIAASDTFVTSNVISSSNMFYGCTSLVGGAGTAYDANHTDGEYARIDGGPSSPGYFTAKKRMSSMEVWLEDLPVSDSDRYTGNEGDSFIAKIGTRNGCTGTNGVTYAHGLEAWIARWNTRSESSWAWAAYQLDGKYEKLTGTITVVSDSYNTSNFDTTIELLGDGKLLCAHTMTPEITEKSVSLDVTGIRELKINVYDNSSFSGGTSFALGDFKLTLRETQPEPENSIYAILYDDGELVFQSNSTPEAGRTVQGNYTVDPEGYDYDNPMPWYDMRSSITTVTFSDTVRPKSTAHWFNNCSNLKQFRQMENLDTSSVTNMSSMFHGCSGLTALDISGWNTSSVTNMSYMFCRCSGLKSLDLSDWNTSSVTNMLGMFGDCSGMMSLDFSSWNTSIVTNMNHMFDGCSNLTRIAASDTFVTSNATYNSDMFSGCTALVGGAGTVYDEEHTDGEYARIDGGPSSPGYFTAKSQTPHDIPLSSMEVWLEDLPVSDSDRYTGNEGDSFIAKIGTRSGCTGTNGVTYAHGLEAWIARWNTRSESSWAWAAYQLDGKYERLKGVITVVSDSYNTDDFDTTIELLGDGIILWSHVVTPDTIEIPVNVDLVHIQELKINVYDNESVPGGTSFALGNFLLTKYASYDEEKAFIDEHLEFLRPDGPYDQTINHTWARIIAKGITSTSSRAGDIIYDVINTPYEALKGDIWDLRIFKNPYITVLSALIAQQSGSQDSEFENSAKSDISNSISILFDLVSAADPNADVDTEVLKQLVQAPSTVQATDPDLYQRYENLYKRISDDAAEKLKPLDKYSKWNDVCDVVGVGMDMIKYVSEFLKFNAQVSAYIETSDSFKVALLNVGNEMNRLATASGDEEALKFAENYKKALAKFGEASTGKDAADMFLEILQHSGKIVTKAFTEYALDHLLRFIGGQGGIGTKIFACIKAYEAGWQLSEEITHNNDITNCRELAQTYYHMEDALLNCTWKARSEFLNESTYENALRFDALYSLLRNVEQEAITNYIHLLHLNQSNLINRIKHGFEQGTVLPYYNEAEIAGMIVEISYWNSAKCHNGTTPKAISSIAVACPTDVFLYDADNQITCAIEDNTITSKQDGITAIVLDDIKLLVVPDLEDYHLEIIGTDHGEADVLVTTFDSNQALLSASAYHVPVSDELTYSIITEDNTSTVFQGDTVIDKQRQVEIVESNGKRYVQATMDHLADDGTIYCAFYSSSGQMIALETLRCSALEGNSFSIPAEDDGDAKKLKIFVLDESFMPQETVLELQIR